LHERKSNEPGALAILLYHVGLSYRNSRDTLYAFETFSHETVRKWYHKMAISLQNLNVKSEEL
jgi:hypothetical protein